MKVLLVSAVLSLGLALPPVAFAQSTGASNPAAATAQTPQPGASQHAAAQRANDSGYGTESGGTSNVSIMPASNHGVRASHEGRNDLFAHH